MATHLFDLDGKIAFVKYYQACNDEAIARFAEMVADAEAQAPRNGTHKAAEVELLEGGKACEEAAERIYTSDGELI